MTRSLDPRIRRLELRDDDLDQQRRQAEDDAAAFRARIGAMAAGYTHEDRDSDPATLANWSPAMRVAWAVRFAPNTVGSLIQEHLA
ncbi:hypothetical protein U1701_17605 [Sphingomonas sp. PB2P19]|uniref:hypothetical protein n=1 Tax=Sphingomonas rhamnosi TaxID=3096156 RepID=UPI002FC92C36